MTANVDKRVNYFDGQFLKADDFVAEQEYNIDRQRAHQQLLHTSGIAGGLGVTANGGSYEALVDAGVAVDSEGRQIVLSSERVVDLRSYSNQTVLLLISYDEEQADTAAVGNGNTRWHERPRVEATAEEGAPPPDTHIRLGRIILSSSGTVNRYDESVRINAGGRLGDEVEVRTLTSSRSRVDPTRWPTLTSGASGRLDLAGGLSTTGDLSAGRNLTVTGNVGIGTTSPGARLDVHGQTILGSDKSTFWHNDTYGDAIGEPTASIGRLEVGGFDDGSGTVPAILRLHQWGSGSAEFYKPPGQTLILRETPTGNGAWFNKFSIMDADVGIGTDSPDNAQGWNTVLDVLGPNHAKLLVRSSTHDVKTGIFSHSNWGGTVGRIGTESSHPLHLTAGYGNDVMTLTTDGNVGIGTVSPAVRLDVNGQTILGSDKSTFWHNDPYGDAIGEPTASIGRLEVGGFDDGSGTVPAILRLHQWGSGSAEFYKPLGQTLILRETPTGNGTFFNKFSIMDADVGIGTTEPEAKLHVAGDFLLQGSQGVMIRSGSFGSSANMSEGNTPDKWIKLGEFVLNGYWSTAGADWEIYPGDRHHGNRRQRVAVHARNNTSDVEGVNIQLLNLDSGYAPALKDVKVVRKSGTGTESNIMAVWVQMASPWLTGQNAITVHYYGTWNELTLETSPQYDSIQDPGTQYDINIWFGPNRADGGWNFMNGNVGIGTTEPAEALHVNGSVRGNQAGALRIDSGNGFVDIGAKNEIWAHFYTDRPRFYFDKGISVNEGLMGSYDGDLSLQTSAGSDGLPMAYWTKCNYCSLLRDLE